MVYNLIFLGFFSWLITLPALSQSTVHGPSSAPSDEEKLIAVVGLFEAYCGECHTNHNRENRNFLSSKSFDLNNPDHKKSYNWNLESKELDSYLTTRSTPSTPISSSSKDLFFEKQYVALNLIAKQSDIYEAINWLNDSPGRDQMPPSDADQRLELANNPEHRKIMLSFLFANLFVTEVQQSRKTEPSNIPGMNHGSMMKSEFCKDINTPTISLNETNYLTLSNEVDSLQAFITFIDPPYAGEIHSWNIRIADANGLGLSGAQIYFDADMIEHGHGMATTPVVSEIAEFPGLYQIDGIKLQMPGIWTFRLDVTINQQNYAVCFTKDIQLRGVTSF